MLVLFFSFWAIFCFCVYIHTYCRNLWCFDILWRKIFLVSQTKWWKNIPVWFWFTTSSTFYRHFDKNTNTAKKPPKPSISIPKLPTWRRKKTPQKFQKNILLLTKLYENVNFIIDKILTFEIIHFWSVLFDGWLTP